MDIGLQIAFWCCSLAVVYTYAGYHILMRLLSRTRDERQFDTPDEWPRVSVLIAMRNEEANAAARVANLLEAQYDLDRLEIIIALDDPQDGTEAKLKELECPQLKTVRLPRQSGKAACLNKAAELATGDLFVFTDARQTFEPDAIRKLAKTFNDERTGATSGELVIAEAEAGAGQGVGAYWRLEKMLRKSEARWGSSIGCTGAIYAIRGSLFEPLPTDCMLDDVVLPMQAAAKGYRILFEPAARAVDPQATEPKKEVRRKVRTLAGNYQNLFRYPSWLMPWKNRLWWQLISHKYARLLAPWCMLAAFICAALLWEHPLYAGLVVVQLCVYGLALVGLLLPRLKLRLVSLPAAFVFLNVVSAAALFAYLFVDYGQGWAAGRNPPEG